MPRRIRAASYPLPCHAAIGPADDDRLASLPGVADRVPRSTESLLGRVARAGNEQVAGVHDVAIPREVALARQHFVIDATTFLVGVAGRSRVAEDAARLVDVSDEPRGLNIGPLAG